MCLEDFVFVVWLSWVAISWHCKAGVFIFALFLGLQQVFLGLVKVAALTTFFTDPSSKAKFGCRLGSGRSTRRCTIFLTSRWPCTLPDVQERDQTVARPNSRNAEHTADWLFSSFAIPPWKCEGFGIKVKFFIYLLCCFDLCVFVWFFLLLLFCVHIRALAIGNCVQDSCKNTQGITLDAYDLSVLALRVAELERRVATRKHKIWLAFFFLC